jgi:DNA primase
LVRVSDESKQRVREATDLVELAGGYTELRCAGSDRMVGLCPLHDERTPSFTISPSKQLFKCFGCDAGGDVLSLIQLKEGLDFPAALEFLARRAGIELQRDEEDSRAQDQRRSRARALEPLDRAAAFYAQHLRSPRSPEATRAAEYLAARGIGETTREAFAVGFAPADTTALLRAAQAAGFSTQELRDVGLVRRLRGGGPLQDRFRGRLMFPVCDARDQVLGFGARKLGDGRGPKYVNSPAGALFSKGQLLYGAHRARAAAAKSGQVIVVEGYIDALAMHQAGIINTVALMGTAMTEHQAAALRRLAPTVVLMLDADTGGADALLRVGALARSAGLAVLVASLPAGSDPALLAERHGAAVLSELVEGAQAFARTLVAHYLGRAELSSAEEKDRVVDELRGVFADIPASAVREELVALVAERLELEPRLLRAWLLPRDGPDEMPEATRTRRSAAALDQTSRDLLVRAVNDPAAAADLPAGAALDALFPDALSRRAAEHICAHPANPTAHLPAADPELVSFVTSLAAAPQAGVGGGPGLDQFEAVDAEVGARDDDATRRRPREAGGAARG